MDGYWQAVGGVLIGVVLCGILGRFGKDVSVLLSLAVCCMVLAVAMTFLQPVVELARNLAQMSRLDPQWLGIVLKTVGIGLISQFAALICTDSGNSAMAKAVEILAAVTVLWLSTPLMTALLELVQTMMGDL